MAKFSIGQKVLLKNRDWYDSNPFQVYSIHDERTYNGFAGSIVTITDVIENDPNGKIIFYRMAEDFGTGRWPEGGMDAVPVSVVERNFVERASIAFAAAILATSEVPDLNFVVDTAKKLYSKLTKI
jgi:hypothetical protein